MELFMIQEPVDLDLQTQAGRTRKGRRRWVIWFVLLAVFLGLTYWITKSTSQNAVQEQKNGRTGSMNVPVTATAARKGDIPVYLNALGSVTAFNTVTVKTRVDGQLIR